MTINEHPDQRFWQLVDESCNRRLDDAELLELDARLAASAMLRRLYFEYCCLHVDLHLVVSEHQALDGLLKAIGVA